MTKMLKFMKPHSKGVSPERLQKQRELFCYSESCFHGFPAKPSALAWDSRLNLVAIATKTGQLRIYGCEGVEFYGHQENTDIAIVRLCFLSGLGEIVSLCEDNSLHLWKIQVHSGKRKAALNQMKSTALEGKLKKISVIAKDAECKNLLIGTEGGNIYVLDLATFTMLDDIIYQDVVMQNVPDDYKVNPGPVEVIAPHPVELNKILIGYQRGLIVLWDRKELCAEQTYISSQQLEYLSWNIDASEFVSSHNDGSFVIWSVENSDEPKEGPTNIYGPFPCKPINKIVIKKNNNGAITVFSGGMPRATYGDRNTVTAMQNDTHVTFNLTSRVVDFIVTDNGEEGDATTLVILAEEEIVFVDLTTEGWPTFANPYLASLHSSAVTCLSFVSKVDSEVFEKLKVFGEEQRSGLSTERWPISGGSSLRKPDLQKDLLLTGHEDGTVRFWDSSGVCLKLLYKLTSCSLFALDDLGDHDHSEDDDDDWPPFRKVGVFDPYSDDPRLGVKKLEMCPHTGQLVVGGTAGQLIVYELTMDEKSSTVQSVDVSLVAENDNFVWKSHSKLEMKKDSIKFPIGMQPLVVIQFYPPASFTSLNLHSEWGLVAAGTAHGFALFDYIAKKNLLSKSTLSSLDMANAADEGPMSRRKTLKQSLRESFRRLRRGRSQKKDTSANTKGEKIINPRSTVVEEAVKPVERAVEARTHVSGYIGSMVRCLHLTKCYIASTQLMSATLWAGTNSGSIYIFTIAIPPSEKRMEVPLTVQLGKEIHLKHGAPVINVTILDGASNPLPEPMAVKRGAAPSPNTNNPHRVVITSEEQFKVFTLPYLKPFCKYKLTAQEGSRIRKVGISEFGSLADETYRETCLITVTNQGDISVYSLPDARKQVVAQCIKREDISGINSVAFSRRGEALYMISASEVARVSLSTKHVTSSWGSVTPLKKIKSPVAEVNACWKKTENSVQGLDSKQQDPVSCSNDSVSSLKRAADDLKENGDNSILSGDTTIDSIRDHMEEVKISDKTGVEPATTVTTALSSESEPEIRPTSLTTINIKETSTTKVEDIASSHATIVSSQETTSIQIVETSQKRKLETNVQTTDEREGGGGGEEEKNKKGSAEEEEEGDS